MDTAILTTHPAAAGATVGALLLTGGLVVGARRATRLVRSRRVTLDPVLLRCAIVILTTVGIGGAAISYEGVLDRVPRSFGPLRYLVPILADGLVLGATLMFLWLVRKERAARGWRTLTHASVGATLYLNYLSSPPGEVPWHLVGPASYSVLVELVARTILGHLREVSTGLSDRIPLRLWITAPGESVLTSWRMARTGERSATAARANADACAAARNVLRRVLPGWHNRGARRQINRSLRAGAIFPMDVFAACRWTSDADATAVQLDADSVLRVALQRVMVAVPTSVPSVPPASLGGTSGRTSASLPGTPGRTLGRTLGRTPTSIAKDAGGTSGGTPASFPRDASVPPGRPSGGTSKGRPGGRSKGRQATKPQAKPLDVPPELTPNEVAVYSVMLGRGDMRRASIFAASGLSDRGAKDALERLVVRRLVEPGQQRGWYRSIDPTGLDAATDVEMDAGKDAATDVGKDAEEPADAPVGVPDETAQ